MSMQITEKAKEIWNFFRTAGVLQAVVDGNAFRNLKDLPNENWAVLSCPVTGLDFDAKTLAFLDGNGDGHIRIEEVLSALDWLLRRLGNMDELLKNSDTIPLASFADTDEGKALKAAAAEMLAAIGKDSAQEITLADVMQRQASFLAAEFNGDGVLVPAAVKDPVRAKLYGEIVAATGGTPDRSGASGVDKAVFAAFLKACADHIAWIEKGKADAATIFPLGDATGAAVAALEAVRAKVEDFFHRSRLVAFDAAATAPLNSKESDYAAVAAMDMAEGAGTIASFPLARVTAGAALPLRLGLNPEWAGKVAAFADAAVKPILGDVDSITEADWRKVCATLAPNIAYNGSVGGASVASLGEARIREILADEKAKKDFEDMVAKDLACSGEIGKLDDLEKFVRYHAHINTFLNNYVNFSAYYDPDKPEIYRAGRLYIDGRVCRECVYVADAGAHATLAASSKMFLAYCNVTRPQTGEKRTICAAVTAGFSASLWVGRNGIFYDAQGNDWNAVIVKICECQISLKEAFWSPWIKISDMIGEQVKKLLSSKETAMMTAANTKVSAIGTEAPPPPPEQKRDGAAMASSVAAIGIAIGIIGSAIGALVSALKGISFLYGVLGVLAIILVVSGPSVILAWFRLRSRDFAPVLNACGWAINKKMLMPMRLSRVFTHEAVVPSGSNISMEDPYVQKHTGRNILIALVLLAAIGFWVWKWHNNWLPESLRRAEPEAEVVESADAAQDGEAAPAAEAEAEAGEAAPEQ